MAKVEIYLTLTCPYCIRAVGLLNRKNVEYTKHNISGNADLRTQMMERTGGKTAVPQIFINDKLIGGCDELHMLDANDELDALLNG